MAFGQSFKAVTKKFLFYTYSGVSSTANITMVFSVSYDDRNPTRVCPAVKFIAIDHAGMYSEAPSSVPLEIYVNGASVYNGHVAYRVTRDLYYKGYATWDLTYNNFYDSYPRESDAGLIFYPTSSPKDIEVRFVGSYNCPTASKTTDTFLFDETITLSIGYAAKVNVDSWPSKIGGDVHFYLSDAGSAAISGYSFKINISNSYGDIYYSFSTTSPTFSKTQKIELSKVVPLRRSRDPYSSLNYEELRVICITYLNGTQIAETRTVKNIYYPSTPTISQSGGLTADVAGSFTFTADTEISSSSCKYVLRVGNTTLQTYSAAGTVSYMPPIGTFGPLITTGLVKSLTFYLDVYIVSVASNNLIGTKSCDVTVTLRQNDVKPSPTATIVDKSGLYSQLGKYVTGISYVEVTVNFGLKYGATKSTNSSKINGVTYTGSPFTTGILNWAVQSSGNIVLTLSVTDSRGVTGTATINLPVLRWELPSITAFSVHRGYYSGGVWTADDNGNYAKIDWATSISALDNHNTKRVEITAPSGQVVPSLSPSGYVDSGTVYSPASTEESYTITIVAIDKYNRSSRSIRLSTAGVVMDILSGGKGIGIGKVAEEQNCIEISPDWTLKVGGMTLAEYIRSIVGTM